MKFFTDHQQRLQWLLMLAALLILALLIWAHLDVSYDRITRDEQARLQTQVRVIDENLTQRLHALDKTLQALSRQFGQASKSTPESINAGLEQLRLALGGTSAVLFVDATGIVRYSSEARIMNKDFSSRTYFLAARNSANRPPEQDQLHLSPPFLSALGRWVLAVSRAVRNERGQFVGAVVISIDRNYLTTLLSSVNYAADQRTAIAHGDGTALMFVPELPGIEGKNLNLPDSQVARHLASGNPTNFASGIERATGERRMLAIQSIKPADIPLDAPLLVGTMRTMDAVYAQWKADRTTYIAIWLFLAIGSVTWLIVQQARQRREQQRIDQADVAVRESEARFRSVLESVALVGVMLDIRGRITLCNDYMLILTGWSRAEILGKDWFALFVPPGAGIQQRGDVILSLLVSGDLAPHQESEILTRDGQRRLIAWSNTVLRNSAGDIVGVASLGEDITQRRESELELRRYRQHLEEQVAGRTRELQLAAREAESANRAKSAFLSNMSHELRTPLNAVIGFSLLMSRSPHLSAEEQHNLSIINQSGNHLLTLINQVLELSKIEAGHVALQTETFALPELIGELIDMLRQRAEQAGLILRLETASLPALVQGDAVKLRQVLINLLGNAIKFTSSGEVSLTVSAVPQVNKKGGGTPGVVLRFAVNDTGIGVAPEDQQRIFEPFAQVVTHASSAGTGLGLSISRQYLRMMGAELQVDSIPGKGSTFSFLIALPLANGTAPIASPRGYPVALAAGEPPRRLLIVEDDPTSRQLLVNLLAPLGFILAEACDGEEAVRNAATFQPDLILMDWKMPRLDGLAATRKILAESSPPKPKIVMLSAHAFDEDKQQAMAAGICDFLSKPLQEAALIATLEKELGVVFCYPDASAPCPVGDPRPSAFNRETIAGQLQSLPADVRHELRTAAAEMNPVKLHLALQRIETMNPGLAGELSGHAAAFRYRELWEVTNVA